MEQAADFLVERFEASGLVPVPGLDGYSQPFELPLTFGYESKSLAAGGEPLPGDFEPFSWASPGTFEGEMVFAGYGVTNDARDDYAELDVEGKVVLVLRYEPFDASGNVRSTGSKQMGVDATFTRKAELAKKNGAAALLVVNPPMFSRDEGLSTYGMGRPFADLPAMHVDRETAAALLERAGLPDLAYLQGLADAGGDASFASDLAVSGGFEAKTDQTTVRNVVGMVEGIKPDEYVVVGAHYDHLGHGEYGSGQPGDIHNGADDNASGTTVLLEVAEAIANGERPERSVIFVGFTAEEVGLVGSRHFVAEPPVKIDKVVAMLNLDMVGRIRDDQVFVGGDGSAEALGPIVADALQAFGLEREAMRLDGNSDHAPFIGEGVPAVFLFSGLHDEYHRPGDDTDLINFDGMTALATAAEQIVYAMASAPAETLAFVDPRRTGVRLGIAAEPGDGRVVIGQVVDDAPAAAAGVQVGDTILAIDGSDIPTLAALRVALNELEPGDAITLLVERGGEEIEARIEFPKQ